MTVFYRHDHDRDFECLPECPASIGPKGHSGAEVRLYPCEEARRYPDDSMISWASTFLGGFVLGVGLTWTLIS